MILNRLILPEDNKLQFTFNYKEGDVDYELKKNETYYMSIAPAENPWTILLQYVTTNKDFSFFPELPEGRYVFEMGIKEPDGFERIVLPALDERRQPLNELLVLRRLRA